MEILQDTSFENIYYLDSFMEEKQSLFGHDITQFNRYSKWLHKQLGLLDALGLNVLKLQSFEPLQGNFAKGLYSIRKAKGLGNPRALFFTMVETGERPVFILLAAFQENNAVDYRSGIVRANHRKESVLNLF